MNDPAPTPATSPGAPTPETLAKASRKCKTCYGTGYRLVQVQPITKNGRRLPIVNNIPRYAPEGPNGEGRNEKSGKRIYLGQARRDITAELCGCVEKKLKQEKFTSLLEALKAKKKAAKDGALDATFSGPVIAAADPVPANVTETEGTHEMAAETSEVAGGGTGG